MTLRDEKYGADADNESRPFPVNWATLGLLLDMGRIYE